MQVKVARLFGIDVYLHWTFVLLPVVLVALLRFREGLEWEAIGSFFLVAGIGLVSVLGHELGHALMARNLGIGIHDILLTPIGGVARLERMSPNPVHELLVTLAGPIVNLAIAAMCGAGTAIFGQAWFPSLEDPLAGNLVSIVMWLNLALFTFNLLPAFPMDGGRILRSLLAMFVPFALATRIAVAIGQTLALLLVGAGIYWQIYSLSLIGGFVYWVARRESLMGMPADRIDAA